MKTNELKDVTPKLTKTQGNHFERLGIVLNDDGGASFDIITQDGKHLARINVFSNSSGWANVDVIRMDENDPLRVMAWNAGERILRERLPDSCNLVAVEFNPPK